VDYLQNAARTLLFSTALPPAAASAALAALEIAREEPWRRERVLTLGARLRETLEGAGYDISSESGPIVPLIVGEPEAAVAWSSRLRDEGFLVPAIRPPTVPKGTSRLRVSLSAAHEDGPVDDLARLLLGGSPGRDSLG
jgi:8-amino-7-oxononanoate synthase